MTVMFLNGKGGAGKTTLSVLFALALHDSGHRPAVRDLDPQGTATRWLDLAVEKEEFTSHADPNVTIFDSPPRLDSLDVLKTARMADKLVLVSSPSPADVFTTKDTIRRVIEPVRGLAKCRVLFNNVQKNTILAGQLDDMAREIGVPKLNRCLFRRQAYQQAVLLGFRSLPRTAREEVFSLALEILA